VLAGKLLLEQLITKSLQNFPQSLSLHVRIWISQGNICQLPDLVTKGWTRWATNKSYICFRFYFEHCYQLINVVMKMIFDFHSTIVLHMRVWDTEISVACQQPPYIVQYQTKDRKKFGWFPEISYRQLLVQCCCYLVDTVRSSDIWHIG